jgi:glycyl-tRNA synthetase beta chain
VSRAEPAEPLLIEIGCEEIPARMIPRAALDLERAVLAILDAAALDHGASSAWGGSRRLSVRCEAVAARQPDRDETLLGPPSRSAFGAEGAPTQAAIGFALKHGIDPTSLVELRTERGTYAGITRKKPGRTLGEILADGLPNAVQAISFPKTMRWADGARRWVRPVHWLVALHGAEVLPISILGVEAGRSTAAHRFLAEGPLVLGHADEYERALEHGAVIADPARRRRDLALALDAGARALGGALVQDAALLDEVADLLEWPGVVRGEFDRAYLELPREILVTTLRHHQKAFAIDAHEGGLVAGFLAVANTDRDPGGHVRRGNEWVVSGRLEDARFFWGEDRKLALEARGAALRGVLFHARAGSYADKAERTAALAAALARELGLPESSVRLAERAARLAKNDLVTGLVGEFPELQGIAGGLLLRAEGAEDGLALAVYEHYRPAGADDPLPESEIGAVVAVADKLDTIAALLGAGERPSGSKDPFALRRAGNGIVRIALARDWRLGVDALTRLGGGAAELSAFLADRRTALFRELGFTSNEIRAALRPNVDSAALGWAAGELRARLDALARVRDRDDFRKLVQLTERVDRILTQAGAAPRTERAEDEAEAARALGQRIDRAQARLVALAADRAYGAIVDELAGFIDPVERFFIDCLVLDPQHPETSARRLGLLARLRELLTRDFDIRELAGSAGRRG